MDLASISTAFTAMDLIRKGLSAAIEVRDFSKAAAELAKLNEALISQQSQIDEMRQTLSKMQSVIDDQLEAPRDLEQERPPHY